MLEWHTVNLIKCEQKYLQVRSCIYLHFEQVTCAGYDDEFPCIYACIASLALSKISLRIFGQFGLTASI